jgi:TonB family protein
MFSSEAVHRYDGKAEERRSCRRATLQWVVLVYFGGDQWGRLVDLSERGMCFQFEQPPALRQSINFTFEAMGCMAIPTEGHEGKVFGDSIQATGRVKWTREFERTAGVEFVELSTRSRDQIRYWLSSAAPHEAPSPSQGLHQERPKKRGKTADRKAVPFASAALSSSDQYAPPEPAPLAAKALFEPRQEVFERDLENRESEIEVVWEPEHPVALPAHDDPATPLRKWPLNSELEAAFTAPNLDEPAISPTEWPREATPEDSFSAPTLEEPVARRNKWPTEPEPEAAYAPPSLDEPVASPGNWPRELEPEPSYLPPTLDEASNQEPEPEDSATAPSLEEPAARARKWRAESRPEPPEPAFAPPEFDPATSERQGFWESKPAFASQAVPQLGFEARQRLGQTLELRQRRGRVGTLAVLGFLATFGAVAGIIRFTSTFNEHAEATEGVAHPASTSEAGVVGEPTGTFLVEVLDTSNRRSVLLFSGGARANKSGHAAQDSSLPETSVMAVEEPAGDRKIAAIRQETPRDFTLSAPHAANSVTTENSAPEAPALATGAPASVDAPLPTLPSPAMPGAPDGPLPVGGEVQPARLIHAMLPSYPQIARANRVAGEVTLDALVDETGTVKDVKVITGPLLLREAAKDALRRWKYEPARLDGKPTAVHLTVTVKFQNNQASH